MKNKCVDVSIVLLHKLYHNISQVYLESFKLFAKFCSPSLIFQQSFYFDYCKRSQKIVIKLCLNLKREMQENLKGVKFTDLKRAFSKKITKLMGLPTKHGLPPPPRLSYLFQYTYSSMVESSLERTK